VPPLDEVVVEDEHAAITAIPSTAARVTWSGRRRMRSVMVTAVSHVTNVLPSPPIAVFCDVLRVSALTERAG